MYDYMCGNSIRFVDVYIVSFVCMCNVQKRLLVFPNGGWLEQVQYVWGDSLARVLENATVRLNLGRPAAYLFTIDGSLVG